MKCITCNKKLKIGDKVYQDGYFFDYHCSWDCLVEYMANFFRVDKDEMSTIEEIE